MAQRRCCPVAGIGVDFLKPSSAPRPLLHLLGLTDQELQEQMAKGHPYEFNMGHGHFIPLNNHGEAAKALMERNFPEILHDRQNKAVFMPEAHLPTMPRVVDIPRYIQRKRKLDEQAELGDRAPAGGPLLPPAAPDRRPLLPARAAVTCDIH